MPRHAQRVADVWLRFWFEPASPLNLGVARVLFFGGLLAFHASYDYSAWGEYSDVFWMPIWLFDALGISQPSALALEVIQIVWKAALFTSAIGLFTRASTLVAFVLGTYLLGLPHNFGQIQHFDTLLALVLGIFAASRAGDAVSVDALRRASRSLRPPQASGEYTWPIRAVWVTMGLIFFAAGVSKLRHGGVEWILSDNLALLLIRQQYHISDGEPLTAWGLAIARRPWLASAMAGAAVAIELSYPLAVVSRFARALLVPAGLAFLIGIRVLMGPTFEQYMLCTLFWIPWDRVVHWIRDRMPVGQYHVFYDGGCGLCLDTVAVIRRLDVLRRVRLHDVTADWAGVSSEFPHLDRDACLTDMHVVAEAGRLETGFGGYRLLANALPAAWPLIPILYVPGVPAVGRCVYRRVARRRHRTLCALPIKP